MSALVTSLASNLRLPRLRFNGMTVGGVLLVLIVVPCFLSLPWSLQYYDAQDVQRQFERPSMAQPMGTDDLGRSLLWRALLGGAISLGIGAASASMAVCIGVIWGGLAGYIGGKVDSVMMRVVDVLYGLPYVLLVVLINLALQPFTESFLALVLDRETSRQLAGIVTLFVAIGSVSWLVMARVIRGQVLSLREQPFVEAARAMGFGPWRIMRVHLLPNIVGPIIVYATLTIPSAILQESFLSFLGIGVKPPLPSWGNLAAEGIQEIYTLARTPERAAWWLLLFPCLLLACTLMALNFLGDALRNTLDPRFARGR